MKRVAQFALAGVAVAVGLAGAVALGAQPDTSSSASSARPLQAMAPKQDAAPAAKEIVTKSFDVSPAAMVGAFNVAEGRSVVVAQPDRAVAATQSFAATCLTAADINAGRGISVRGVNWRAGLIDVYRSKPLCAGVAMKGAGGQYAFQLGAKPGGTVGRPSIPLWPQLLVATTPWQNLTRSGVVRYRFPPVLNQCSQTDVAVWANGGSGTWPRRLERPGVPQPRGVAYYVGNNRGCYPAPSVRVQDVCTTDCDGIGTVTTSACTTAPYAHTRVWIVVAGKKYRGVELTPQARCKSFAVRLADGTPYSFLYQVGFGVWGPETKIGGNYLTECPPKPDTQTVINCPCVGAGQALVNVKNKGRYTLIVWATVNGTSAKAITVNPGASGTLQLGAIPKNATVKIYVRSYLGKTPKGGNVLLRTLTLS